jgi:hypothetical protein
MKSGWHMVRIELWLDVVHVGLAYSLVQALAENELITVSHFTPDKCLVNFGILCGHYVIGLEIVACR